MYFPPFDKKDIKYNWFRQNNSLNYANVKNKQNGQFAFELKNRELNSYFINIIVMFYRNRFSWYISMHDHEISAPLVCFCEQKSITSGYIILLAVGICCYWLVICKFILFSVLGLFIKLFSLQVSFLWAPPTSLYWYISFVDIFVFHCQ